MLTVEAISLDHGRTILNSINFQLNEGEIMGIVGKSGAGKTSLLKIIAGLKEPTSGEVIFEGKKVIGPTVKLVPGHDDIQLVNQDFGLDLYHSTLENIREKILYLPSKQRDKFVLELLELVELSDLKDQAAHTLSGGEQQRLAIARALACEPKLLLLDEPFVHLDTRLKIKITNYLLEMKEVRNMSVILVSHDGAEIVSLCSKIAYIKHGKIKRISSPRSAYYHYKTIEEGELYGWVNAVQLDGKRCLFRPDEYEIASSTMSEIPLKYRNSTFEGGFYLNFFTSNDEKNVVLLSLETLNHVGGINIRKKS